MNKSAVKIVSTIILISMTLALLIGSVAMSKSSKYLTREIDQKIINTAENYSNEFSSQFNHMSGLTDGIASYVETSFDIDEFNKMDKEYLQKYKIELAKLITKNLETSSLAHSLYVTFNPEFTNSNEEVWYVVDNGNIKEVTVDFDNGSRDFDLPYSEDMAYFFKPQNSDNGAWTGPYYDKDIDQDVFSYSRAIYIDGTFVGVAGADIDAADTISAVTNMKLYPDGYSVLLNGDMEPVIIPKKNKGEEGFNMNQNLKEALKAQSDKNSGKIVFELNEEDKIIGFSTMDNGWMLLVTQPEAQATAPVTRLKNVMMILAVILGVVLAVTIYLASLPVMRKQRYLEEENEQKEIMLVYQSRQAKIGEMVGNITHQWKQPLNSINLILANLLDSYRYGDLDENRLKKSVNKVSKITEKMADTINDFSGFLKPSKEKEAFDVRDSIHSALSLMEESINRYNIKIVEKYSDTNVSYGYVNELTHVIFNILNNARDAIVSSEPQMRIIRIETIEGFNSINIRICNNGSHIKTEDEEHLFEPYFTTKPSSEGTGLGLYISKQIISDRMGGNISIYNIPEGVCCSINIPTAVSAQNLKECD